MHLDVDLKLGDYDTLLDSNTIVAQVIADYKWAADWWGCLSSHRDSLSVQRYNDTLLIVGTATGWDTVPALSFTAPLVYRSCNDSVAQTESALWEGMCYPNPTDPSDTICSLPFRYIRDVHLYEFGGDTTSYHTFGVDFLHGRVAHLSGGFPLVSS